MFFKRRFQLKFKKNTSLYRIVILRVPKVAKYRSFLLRVGVKKEEKTI